MCNIQADKEEGEDTFKTTRGMRFWRIFTVKAHVKVRLQVSLATWTGVHICDLGLERCHTYLLDGAQSLQHSTLRPSLCINPPIICIGLRRKVVGGTQVGFALHSTWLSVFLNLLSCNLSLLPRTPCHYTPPHTVKLWVPLPVPQQHSEHSRLVAISPLHFDF